MITIYFIGAFIHGSVVTLTSPAIGAVMNAQLDRGRSPVRVFFTSWIGTVIGSMLWPFELFAGVFMILWAVIRSRRR